MLDCNSSGLPVPMRHAALVGVKLLVVLGHTSCGAVKGAIDDAKLGNLTALLAKIRPAVSASGPCKTAQFYATRCESRMTELPSVSNGVQRSENPRKNSFLNYKSAVLPAELCRQG